MRSTTLLALLLLGCFASVVADVYLHMPRGSNGRLNEQGTNRNNGNRLMDTQNNAQGGYCINVPNKSEYYYEGSQLTVEWTAQHGCGNGKTRCNFVLQYMCTDGSDPTVNIRDGTTTDTIPNDPAQYNTMDTTFTNLFRYGMHESYSYYQACTTRFANKGLWLADQNLNSQGTPTARYTRQNNNGGRSGFECPEERDYYPYWHPAPWKDIAVLTDDLGMCKYYQTNSQNVVPTYQCVVQAGSTTFVQTANTQALCNAIPGATWQAVGPLGGGRPDCLLAPLSRENHLGNVVNAHPARYNWTLPTSDSESCISAGTCTCVFRMRYNITTGDIVGFGSGMADSKLNGQNSPVKGNPTVNVGLWNMTLALNTAQHGRTFQDRSHTFSIVKRPSNIVSTARIYNLNVRGKRGNIVQVYPSVEYDFSPNALEVRKGDYVHFQWVGCDNNPAGNAGEGKDRTDRSNIVEFGDSSTSLLNFASFMSSNSNPLFDDYRARDLMAGAGQNLTDCDPNTTDQQNTANCKKLNAAPAYFDGGLYQQNTTGTKRYMSTRNNNFSNRDQKGVLVVNPLLPVWGVVLVVFGSAAFVAAAVVGGGIFYAQSHPSSSVANLFNKI